MARTYDATKLTLQDPTNQGWALAWVRRFAGDIPNQALAWPLDSLEDDDWMGWLLATAYNPSKTFPPAPGGLPGYFSWPLYPGLGWPIYPNITYYRPHTAAAAAVQANPYWLERESILGTQSQYRSAEAIAGGIARQGAFIDTLIRNAERAGGRRYTPGGGNEWHSVF